MVLVGHHGRLPLLLNDWVCAGVLQGRLAEASGTGGPERCPSCSAGFDSVEGLIRHCELFHMDDGKERCPECGYMCRDAVSLCEHVERAHSVRAQCVLC